MPKTSKTQGSNGRGPGRPPKPAAEKQSRALFCSLTPADARRVKRAARQRGESVSVVLRRGLEALGVIDSVEG